MPARDARLRRVTEERIDEAAAGSTLEQAEAWACARAVGRVFWGLLLVVVDFQLDGIDVLPDELGLLLIVSGAGRLAGYSGALFLASLIYLADLVLLVARWFGAPGPPDLVETVLGTVQILALMLGMGQFATRAGNPRLASSFFRFATIVFVWCAILWATGVGAWLAIGPVTRHFEMDPVAAMLVVLAGFAFYGFFLLRLRQLRAWLLES